MKVAYMQMLCKENTFFYIYVDFKLGGALMHELMGRNSCLN